MADTVAVAYLEESGLGSDYVHSGDLQHRRGTVPGGKSGRRNKNADDSLYNDSQPASDFLCTFDDEYR